MFALRKRSVISFISNSCIIVSECRYLSQYKAHEGSKYMQKLLNKKGAKAKRKWYQPHFAEPLEMFGAKQQKNKHGVTPEQRIRATQLGHVLYDKITHIINTGELSEEIFSKQVFITSVKMQSDFGGVNVYWDSSRSDAAEIEPLLSSHAGKLRSLLISYHVLGRIPPVTFVKDKSMGDLTLLNQLFEVADYGPDYIPSSQQNKAQADVTGGHLTRWGSSSESLSSKPSTTNTADNAHDAFLTPHSRQKHDATDCVIQKAVMDKNGTPCTEIVQPSEPENQAITIMQGLSFRSNLYGLPHDNLMKKVIASRTKVKFQSNETPSSAAEDTTNFDMKQLNSRKDKMKLKSFSDSTKFKQQILERDFEDYVNSEDGN